LGPQRRSRMSNPVTIASIHQSSRVVANCVHCQISAANSRLTHPEPWWQSTHQPQCEQSRCSSAIRCYQSGVKIDYPLVN
jgi:hypothetical protein